MFTLKNKEFLNYPRSTLTFIIEERNFHANNIKIKREKMHGHYLLAIG
jgi:hypothetical protein